MDFLLSIFGLIKDAFVLLFHFVFSPATILIGFLVFVLWLLAIVIKIQWAINLWGNLILAVDNALKTIVSDSHAFIILITVALFFPQYAAIGALAYVVAKALGLKL